MVKIFVHFLIYGEILFSFLSVYAIAIADRPTDLDFTNEKYL